MKDYPTRNDYIKIILQFALYLVDQNIRDYHIGTRPTKYFQVLHLALPQNSTDKEILDYAIKNNLIIVTNDKLFVLENLINHKTVIFQDNYGIRYYLKIKNSFVFDFVKYDSVDTFPLRKKETLLHRIKRNINPQKSNTQSHHSYLADFRIRSQGYTRSNSHSVSCDNIFSYELAEKKHNEQLQYVLSYAIQNNLTIITKSKFLCILSLIKTKRCIFEDGYGTRHYISLHDSFEFERVSLVKKDIVLPRDNIILKEEPLQYNISQIEKSLDYIKRNLHYIETQLVKRKELEASVRDTSSFDNQPNPTKEMITLE